MLHFSALALRSVFFEYFTRSGLTSPYLPWRSSDKHQVFIATIFITVRIASTRLLLPVSHIFQLSFVLAGAFNSLRQRAPQLLQHHGHRLALSLRSK